MTFVKWLDYTFTQVFTPETLGVLAAAAGIFYKLYIHLIKKVDSQHKDMMETMLQEINEDKKERKEQFKRVQDKLEETNKDAINHYRDLNKEVLRLQILQGMSERRLSISEVNYFYEKYHRMGGDSFVTAKVKSYTELLEKEGFSNGGPPYTNYIKKKG